MGGWGKKRTRGGYLEAGISTSDMLPINKLALYAGRCFVLKYFEVLYTAESSNEHMTKSVVLVKIFPLVPWKALIYTSMKYIIKTYQVSD